MDIGARIKQKRKEKRWSQTELAAACGWDNTSRLGHYERGFRNPGVKELDLLAKALDVSVEWLTFGTLMSESDEHRKVPLLRREDIRHWLSGKYYPRKIRTLLSVSDKAFAYRVADVGVERFFPTNAIALFDPEQKNNLSAFRLAMIRHNGALSVKEIVYDSGVLFFTGGLLTIQGSLDEVIAPLISLPEVTISSSQ